MVKKRDNYQPCSELDLRAAALRSTHERLRELDNKGIPSVGKFGIILSEEKGRFRILGEYMAEKGMCSPLTWEELKKAANEHAKGGKQIKKNK